MKRKEADEIEIADLPRAAHEYEAWFEAVASTVCSSALDGDLANQWIYAVDDPSATFENMNERGVETSLDDKIRTAPLKKSTSAAYQ